MAEIQCPHCPSRQCSLNGGRVRKYFAQPYRCRICKKSFKAPPIKPIEEIIEDLPPEHTMSFKSKSGDGYHKTANMCGVFLCTCPHFYHTHKDCWHINGLKRAMNVPIKPTLDEVLEANKPFTENEDLLPVILKRPRKTVCPNPECGSIDINKAGHNNDSNRTQRYLCKTCGRWFSDNLGSENKRATAQQIAFVLGERKKMSCKETIERLESVHKVKICRTTIYNWQNSGVKRIDAGMKNVRPRVSEEWSTDEVHNSVKGKSAYTIAVIDTETKFCLASDTVRSQGKEDAVQVFMDAAERAGKKPSQIKSDKADYFASAYKKVYAAKNDLQKQCIHEQVEHLTHENNNGAHESFNGTKIRPCTNNMRGIKSMHTPQILTAEINHNYIMPHEGLSGMTPAEAAGIHIHGHDKWLVLLELAAYWEYHKPTMIL